MTTLSVMGSGTQNQFNGDTVMSKYETTPAVLFDIDGTLADCEHRRHHVTGKHKDFDAFYAAMAADTPNEPIVQMCNLYYANRWHVVLCTGRPESYRKITEDWLHNKGVMYHGLMMRPDERRFDPDYLVKQDMLGKILETRAVHFAVDDRTQVVNMWRENGVTCLQVAEGNF